MCDLNPIYEVKEKFFWPHKNLNPDKDGYVHLSWWRHNPDQSFGGFDSYLSALADNSGCWEEYCEFHRTKAA